MKIQLIGAYSKIGPAMAIPIFNVIHKALEARGWEVSNPCMMIEPETEWGKAMEITMANLIKMDAVYVIENWTQSPGSLLEIKEAIILGLDFYNKKNPPKYLKK